MCACFGDPHCLSWDSRLLTFQGKCQYVMASDHCAENPDTPKFEVYSTFTDRNSNLPVSWVQDVTVKINNYVSFLFHLLCMGTARFFFAIFSS